MDESKDYFGKKVVEEFVVMAHNVPCGTSGVTCTKLIDVRVGGSLHLQLIQGRAPMVNNQSVDYMFKSTIGCYAFVFQMFFKDCKTSFYLDFKSSKSSKLYVYKTINE